jgi:hypothetical protein
MGEGAWPQKPGLFFCAQGVPGTTVRHRNSRSTRLQHPPSSCPGATGSAPAQVSPNPGITAHASGANVMGVGKQSATTGSVMDVSTLVFGTALTVLPLVAAGLLAAMVLLERHTEDLASAPGHAGRGHSRPRHRKPRRRHRA